MRVTSASEPTSPGSAVAVPPAASIAATVAAARSASMSLTPTRAPSDAKRSATARPMPWPAPVTRTQAPSKRLDMGGLLRLRSGQVAKPGDGVIADDGEAHGLARAQLGREREVV